MSNKKFVAIIGAGSVGCWLGGRLRAAGHEVAILREKSRIQRDNEIIVLEEGEEEERVELPVWEALEPKPDIILLAVKAMFLPQVAPLLAANMKEDTLVLPLQNGVPFWFAGDETVIDVDPVGSVRTAVGQANIIGTVVHASVSRKGDWITVGKADKLLLGEPSGSHSARVAELVQLFRDAGVPSAQSDNIRNDIWYKLWGNLTINPLSALTRQTVDRLLDDEDVLSFIRRGMEECAAIGEAIGCSISDSIDDRLDVTRTLGVFKPSMLQDLEAGRPLEYKALVAAPRAIAREHGIETPAIDALLGMIRQLDGGLV
ncbi:ketopantoate reductase family protein [Sphingomicrobium aestuariivivum]|uniref:ketopantoate reductase family protein n=1 Tax=Sphingomicrobium aestuariivivum TaxID=1582356 RepID=UPI001FD685A0|nr:2-dehydropantoate 2-reductase [Sphingomicrobium aestuariivivum]MCJ8190900.1 2-dehydropantoate 2-reductase [Sphingomicrobium aestuariivivum]